MIEHEELQAAVTVVSVVRDYRRRGDPNDELARVLNDVLPELADRGPVGMAVAFGYLVDEVIKTGAAASVMDREVSRDAIWTATVDRVLWAGTRDG